MSDKEEKQEEEIHRQGIAFSFEPHPITGSPIIRMIVNGSEGTTASIMLNGDSAINLGAQTTAWGNWLFGMEQGMKIAQAQQEAEAGGLIIPKR
jgi:hypothetical protein